MNFWKRSAVLLLSAVCCFSLCACSIPVPGYSDYDVSNYVQALLDSSYHDTHEALMEAAHMTEESARENNATTVENAAVRFCNTYGISPSQQQLEELQMVMKQAFALSRYTVKEERKVDGGYYLEVEVYSILNFENKRSEIDRMKEEARQEALQSGGSMTADPGSSPEGDDTDPTPPPASSSAQDPNELFVEKVLSFCKQELANIAYDTDPRVKPLDIVQTDQGELQLDLNQIDAIDLEIIRF